MWKMRNLTITRYTESLVLSQWIYRVTCMYIPSVINLEVFAQVCPVGLESRLKSIYLNIIKMICNTKVVMDQWFQSYFTNVNVIDLFNTRYDIPEKWKQSSHFNMIYSLKAIMLTSLPLSSENVLEEFIWLTSHINTVGEPVFYKGWYDMGIK